MKWILSPAIFLMDRLGLKHKFYLVVGLCLVPIVVLSYFTLVNVEQHITVHQTERKALAFVVVLRDLSVGVAELRGVTNAYLHGDSSISPAQIFQRQQRIESMLLDLEALERNSDPLIPDSEHSAAIRTAWNEALSTFDVGQSELVYQAYSEVNARLIDYFSHIGHVGRLLQDADLHNAYLADIIVLRLPRLIESIAQIRSYGTGVLLEPRLRQVNHDKLVILIDRLRVQYRHIASELDRVMVNQPSARETLENYRAAINGFLQLAGDQLVSGTGKDGVVQAQTFFAKGTATIDLTAHLFDEMLPVLQTSLANNIAHGSRVKYGSLLVILVTIGLMIYLLVGFYASFSSRLRQLLKGAEYMAAGDLTHRLDVHANDELGQISKAMCAASLGVSQAVLAVIRTSNLFTDVAQRMSESSKMTENSVVSQMEDSHTTDQSISELSEIVQDVASNIAHAADSAQQAETSTNEGRQAVAGVVESIHLLATDMERVGTVISELNAGNQKISAILDLIRGISEQTNLLALNAAIEAARAGEQGRGFAVVADEVRQLASRTHEATQDIQTTLDELQTGSQQAVAVMQASEQQLAHSVELASNAGRLLEEITEEVSSISNMNSRIAVSAEQQSNMARVLANNVANMTSAARQASAMAKSTTDDASIVKALASEAHSLINHFVVNQEWLEEIESRQEYVLFQWDDSFSVGLPEIDRQHKILVGMINELNQHICLKRNMLFLRRILQGVIDYTESHFAYEEDLLERNAYEDLAVHKQKHVKLIAEVKALQTRLDEQGESVMPELLTFLKDWLSKHILGADKDYGRVLTKDTNTHEVEFVEDDGLELF